MNRFYKKISLGAAAGGIAAVLAVVVWLLGWLDPWEAQTWDWRVRLLARPGPATEQIAIILLDQNSLDWAQRENGLSWPWPRELYGAITDFCRRAGAKALAFDVLYTEPSAYGVGDDAAFAQALAAYGRATGALFLGAESGAQTHWPAQAPDLHLKPEGLERWLATADTSRLSFRRASFPIEALATGYALLGNVHLDPDPDGVYRRAQTLQLFDNRAVPALGLALYLAATPSVSARVKPGELIIDDRRLPIDDAGRVILRFRGPAGTYATYSAAAVLQSEIQLRQGAPPNLDPALLKDKYVLFGFSAPGLYDLRSAPVGGIYPGVEIHATLLDNFLSQDFFQPLPKGVTVTLVLLLTLLCGVVISLFAHPAAVGTGAALFFLVPVGLVPVAYGAGLWLPLVVQETALVLTLTTGLIVKYATEGRQKRFIKNAFSQYLSPAVIEQLIRHPERLKLGGERRELSIFFSDLQGFTSISEGLSPEALTQLLNDYLTEMTEIIHQEQGTVDKYEGDAIIAFWNAPLNVPDHALRAVRAAMRCQQRLAEIRPHFAERIGKELHMRIGLNSGPAVVGNMGSHSRFDYTMLGDAVNLAARLEGANKQFGTYTMLSEQTARRLDTTFRLRELARLAVVGRNEPVTVYEPMSDEAYQTRKAHLERFRLGLQAFYQGDFGQAGDLFQSIAEVDPAAAAYLAQCRLLNNAVPERWQGVWKLTSK